MRPIASHRHNGDSLTGKHFDAVMQIATTINLELPVQVPPHLIVYGAIVVLLKIIWDVEGSGQPLVGTELPAFEEWAHHMHAELAQKAPIISAPYAPLLCSPRRH